MCMQAVLEPFTYATSKKGKELRARIIDAFNAWLDVPVEKLETIGRIVSMLHNASLLSVLFLMPLHLIAKRNTESTTLKMSQTYDAVPLVWHFYHAPH